ncbi:Uncharacterised protein [Niallia circulans]|nr:Uncharacterised protein [Niallia circulans]
MRGGNEVAPGNGMGARGPVFCLMSAILFNRKTKNFIFHKIKNFQTIQLEVLFM